MNFKGLAATTLSAVFFVCVSFAEIPPGPRTTVESQGPAAEKSAAKNELLAVAIRKSSDTPTTPTGNSEVFEGIYLGIGKTVSLDSKLDYSSATTVAVGIQCIICDSYAVSLGTSGLVLLARWAVPNAELYVTTENKAASTFLYWDAGGAIFNVYGSQFRLSLQNNGKQPIAIEQVTLFRRGQ